MSFMKLPRLYAILDGAAARAGGFDLLDAARSLREAGVQLVQYRDKTAHESAILNTARAIRSVFDGSDTILVLNDWPEIAVQARWDGVHVGQSDVSVLEARRIVGAGRLVGTSTHSLEQFHSALKSDADYIAYGPIFSTTSKQNAESPLGIHGLREVRGLSQRALVAIGGVSPERMAEVFAAGADSVAVIGALYKREQTIFEAATQLLQSAEIGEH